MSGGWQETRRQFHAAARARLALLAGALAVGLAGCAHTQEETYKPSPGQAGKDVVWVPSPPAVVERMLDVARVTAQDFVMDLGSGDGRYVIAAARRGARATGVEFNPDLVALSNRSAQRAGVSGRATFVEGDMFAADISRADVLALFLLPDNLRRLTPQFLKLKPGTRIVVNFFGIPDWEADYSEEMTADCQPWCIIKLYIVPAQAAGTWRMPQGELVLEQSFQLLRGTLAAGGVKTEITGGRVTGDRVSFNIGAVKYTGQLNGARMSGERAGPGVAMEGLWAAERQ